MTQPAYAVAALWPTPADQERERAGQAALEALQRLHDAAFHLATVIGVRGDRVVLASDRGLFEAHVPSPVVVAESGLRTGALVKVVPETRQILALMEVPPFGAIVPVRRILSEHLAEVDDRGQLRLVLRSRDLALRVDDRVVLDFTSTAVVHNLGQATASEMSYTEAADVEWDDIGGLTEAKRALREAIEGPVLHADTYRRFGRKPVRGVLLHGPPGCGKTFLSKAVATALAKLHGAEARASGYIYVRGPELLNKYVGESEAAVRRVFAHARDHHRRHDVPAVVVFDECDAIFGQRGRGGMTMEGMEKTIVPMMLAEMDGLGERGAFVIFATNRPDTLDGAIVRAERVDQKIAVTRPTQADAATIAAIHLRGKPVAEGLTPEALIEEMFAPRHVLFQVRTKGAPGAGSLILASDRATDETSTPFRLADLMSGAAIAGVVERATQRAIRRELSAGQEQRIEMADVVNAVAEVVVEERDVNHEMDVASFAEAKRLTGHVVRVDKAT